MSDFRADLHCHSTCSDGSDAPLELVKEAKKRALHGLSITDHDTAAAYTPELFAQAEALSLRIVTGVEISTELEGLSVHILGYGYDLHSLSFSTFLQDIQKQRAERNRSILKKLANRNMSIAEEELLATETKTIGRPHIAALMVKKGYVSSVQQAFDWFLKDGAPCDASGFQHTPQEAIKQIQQGGGKAILAHPHFYKREAYLKKILSCSFDGIECYYASLPLVLELPWVHLAKDRGWIVTGGSDYHGVFKNILLGSSWVGLDIFNTLLVR